MGVLGTASALPRPAAVLFDRDGTLVEDVPYNANPDRVAAMPGAAAAVTAVRAAGIRTAVVTNQSGVSRGLLTRADVRRVNSRIDAMLGPFDAWLVCPHGPDDHCGCRKPAPGLVLWAARKLRVPVDECVVIGDIDADVRAANAAGARGILVPTPRTRPDEVASAPDRAGDLPTAVRRILRTT